MKDMEHESNGQLELAAKIIEQTGCSLFLTGRAGTGKTTFLRDMRKRSRKRMIVTAPTGIAAINAGGVTLHSFFQLDFGVFVPGMKRVKKSGVAFSKEKIRMIRGLDLLVIDEISMVRADMLDAVDEVLRRYRDHSLPFGGVQLLLIGDLQQLPPVVTDAERSLMQQHYPTPYFFGSHALSRLDYLTIELKKVYRQSDRAFLDLLNAVRDNRADAEVLRRLNSRHIPGFEPDENAGYVRLTTHNEAANNINRSRLAALGSESHLFHAKISGNFPSYMYPADEHLELKEGTQVMFIKNDTGSDRMYFNGMMGKVTTIDEDGVVVTPDNGEAPIAVEPVQWENLKFEVNEATKEIAEKIDGTFSQLPLKLAWAITIHKSQGLTFDRAIINATNAFSHGQTYVALSRCRTLEGMVLEQPLTPGAIICDPAVQGFMHSHDCSDMQTDNVEQMVHAYELHLAAGMFDFRPIFNAMEVMERIYQEHFMSTYPSLVQKFVGSMQEHRANIISVGDKFRLQMIRLDNESMPINKNEQLAQRTKDASQYFLARLRDLADLAAGMPQEHDNKKTTQKLRDAIEYFHSVAAMRKSLLTTFADETFTVDLYLDLKAAGAFAHTKAVKKSTKGSTAAKQSTAALTDDNVHPEMFEMLNSWRAKRAHELGVARFQILATKTLLAISNYLPVSYGDLSQIPGVGPVTIKRYGEEILDMVDEFMAHAKDLKLVALPTSKPKE